MGSVKGSKSYEMVVVTNRPIFRVMATTLLICGVCLFGMFTYYEGKERGMAIRAGWLVEHNQLREELLAASKQIKLMQKEVATLRVGSAIDEKANAEIRDTVELQQESIAELKEEISFYKGVMAPGSDQKGLRVESFDVSIPDASNKVEYSLLLTQVVENHELVQGKVEVSVSGMMGRNEEILALNKLDDDKVHPVSFRFRYFQNINGEMVIPKGFEPQKVQIVAQTSGRKSQRLERSFTWPLNGG